MSTDTEVPDKADVAADSRGAGRALREVVFVDGVRTPFGKAGPNGAFAATRADDLVVAVVHELLRRNPAVSPASIDEVAIAATSQTGDQGMTIGRNVALLAGLPVEVPGFAIDRMCAGAMTSVTTTASGIAFGAYDVVIAGGVEHMGRHPFGATFDLNPRHDADRLDDAALNMGKTAENLHDRYPLLTKERADAYAVASQVKFAEALRTNRIQPDLVEMRVEAADGTSRTVTNDEQPRPDTSVEKLATLRTPFRDDGKVTAGNSAGLNDGAAGCLLMAEDVALQLGLRPRMRLVSYGFAGVEPQYMGEGPVPSTEKALKLGGLSISDIGLFELNEAFAVQVLTFLDHFGIADDDPRVNPYGGSLAMGHPLASSGVRLMSQLSRQFDEHPEIRYGLTAMCVGLGMGGTVIWENPSWRAGA